jgi:hypothetical protein
MKKYIVLIIAVTLFILIISPWLLPELQRDVTCVNICP